MALIVEDGTGKADAQTYNSESALDAYHTAHGNTAWASATSTAKDVASLRGAEWLDHHFGPYWAGGRSTSTQRLDWPRAGVSTRDGYTVDNLSVPELVANAHAEAALRALTNEADLFLDEVLPGSIKREKVKAGPVETDTTYLGGQSAQTFFTKIEAMLEQYLGPRSTEVRRA